MTGAGQQVRYSYLVVVIGVALLAISEIYVRMRGVLARGMSGSNGAFGNRQLGGVNPLYWTNSLTILAVIVAIVGLAWLGLALRKSRRTVAS